MLKPGQLVWVNKRGEKGAGRVVYVIGGDVVVRFLEPGRGDLAVDSRFVEVLELPPHLANL